MVKSDQPAKATSEEIHTAQRLDANASAADVKRKIGEKLLAGWKCVETKSADGQRFLNCVYVGQA